MSLANLPVFSPMHVRPPGLAPSAAARPGADGKPVSLIRRIEAECRAGLPNEKRARLDAARVNQDFYDLNFDPYVTEWVKLDRNAIRTTAFLRRVVEVLTSDLYREGPTRTVVGSAPLTDWLQKVYKANAIDAILQEADRLAVVHQVAAIEVQGAFGAGSESRPIEHVLWGGDSFAVWLEPDNPRKPLAVATIDRMDEAQRIRLWTKDERVVFVSAKATGLTAGGTTFAEQKRDPNPYGVLPFAFAHFRFPTSYFWSGGLGDHLRRINHHLNYRLSVSADDVLHSRPIGVIEGARADWNFPRDLKRGEWTTIPPAIIDAAGGGVERPEAHYVTCDSAYLAQDWDDLRKYLDEALEMLGVPASAVRLEQHGAVSGVAIFAEQLPVVKWAESRQPHFAHYERDLARVTFAVAAAHAENNERDEVLGASVAQLREAADDPDLSLRWKSQLGPLLAMQRQQWDMFRMQFQLVSKTQWVSETYGLSREEAEEMVVETAHDVERETKLFTPPPMPGEEPAEPGAETAPEPPPDASGPPPTETEPEPEP